MDDSSVTAVIVCSVTDEKTAEFLQLVDGFLATRPRHCLSRDAYSRLAVQGSYCLVERWADLAHLVAHRASTAHRALVGGIRTLGVLEGEQILHARGPGIGASPRLVHLVAHDLKNPCST